MNGLPKLTDPFANNPWLNTPTDNNTNLDDLLKKIDDKIEELEELEKMEKVEKQDVKVESEISKFKIDDENK